MVTREGSEVYSTSDIERGESLSLIPLLLKTFQANERLDGGLQPQPGLDKYGRDVLQEQF